MPTFTEDVGAHWRIRCVYSYSQSDSGNYTDISMDTYWESVDSYGTTYTSDTKSGSSTIDGTRDSFSFNAKLSGKQSRKVNTQTKRVSHDAEGKARITLSATLAIELTLGGSYIGSRTASETVSLPTIPRTSSMTSSASWTAGSDRTVSISRASSSFRHEAEMSVKNRDGSWRWVNQVAFSTSQTSLSTGFSENGNKAIFQALDGRGSADSRIVLQTFSGSTQIGEKEYTGTVTAPASTDVSSINGQYGGTATYNNRVYIDQEIKIGLGRKDSEFTHKVIITAGTFTKTFTAVETSVTFTLTSAEQASIYNQIKSAKSLSGNIEVTTYYAGEVVRSVTNSALNFYVKDSINKPTLAVSSVSYADTNTAMTTITGNNQQIVQSKSTLRVTIGTAGTMKNGATFSKYIISVDGQEKTLSTATGNVTFTSIKGGTNQSLSVKVIDSRGLSSTVTKTVTVIPYTAPVLVVKATRQDLFGATTTIKMNGTFSTLSTKNTVTSLKYKITNKGTGAVHTAQTAVTPTKSGATYTATVTADLNVTDKFTVEAVVVDTLGTSVTVLVGVEAGQPIFFIDAKNRSLGFNDFPTGTGEFKVNGRITFGANMYANANSGEGFGALWLNNSDIGGVNGLFFNDVANNKGEGLLFLLSTAEAGSPFNADYNTWHIRDGQFMLDMTNYMTVRETSGSTNNASVTVGAGGLTIIGAGESADTAYAGLVTNGTWNDSTERMVVTSDTDVHVHTQLGTNWASRNSWTFSQSDHAGVTYPSLTTPDGAMLLRGQGLILQEISTGSSWLRLKSDSTGQRIFSDSILNRSAPGSSVTITSSGTLGIATSARKYKTDIKADTTLEHALKILDLNPSNWIDKNAYYGKLMTDMGFPGDYPDAPTVLSRSHGLIAEDLVDAGIPEFVDYTGDGEVNGIHYERLWTLLLPIVKNLREEVETLKQLLNQ